MVKRCAWGTCNSDSRYPKRLVDGVTFVPFPKLGRTRDKALRWICLCGRPRNQLNEEILRERRRAKHLFVCTKHFVDSKPSLQHPDPLPALSYDRIAPARRQPTPRNTTITTKKDSVTSQERTVFRVTVDANLESIPPGSDTDTEKDQNMRSKTNPLVVSEESENIRQSDENTNYLEILALAAENRQLKQDIETLNLETGRLQQSLTEKESILKREKEDMSVKFAKVCIEKDDLLRTVKSLKKNFHVKDTSNTCNTYFRFRTMKPENFQYYTGFSHERYLALGTFLIPNDQPFQPLKAMGCLSELSLDDQLLLVLMKLRQNFDFKHLALLFGISQQDCSSLFTDWINYMFYRLGSVPIWAHRDVVIENMPEEFKADFPNTISIIDGTEVKIQRPSSLCTQSQFYSDYKSSTTLKGLIGVDPRGSVTFASMLFSGSISDKELTKQSGYYKLLQNLLENGMLKENDSIMADKGFTIEKELKDLGLTLNIPPFASNATQMSASQVSETIKIAKHRVHVERAIARVKQFKILSGKLSLGMFKSVNQIWLVCCLLTNFMPFLLSKD